MCFQFEKHFDHCKQVVLDFSSFETCKYFKV